MIEKQDDLYPLMFDVQLAYAFQDVEKNHNPKSKKKPPYYLINKIQCVIRYNFKKFFIIRYPNCKRLNFNHHFTHWFFYLIGCKW
jgi:hypothetical protein